MIDLHLHLDGSLPVKTVLKLAKMQNIQLPTDNTDELKTKYLMVNKDCKDLTEYLERFDLPVKLMQTKEALEICVHDLLEELKQQGLMYAEIRFAPQLHTMKGLTQKEVVESCIKGLKSSDLKANLILCCMRGNTNHKENIETVELVKEFLNRGVCALDLAGAEAIFPTKDFKDLFTYAKELNIPFTIHAGEADGSISVAQAIEFGASRIGHGVRSIDDPNVVKLLIKKEIPIEVCPKSNYDTKTFPDMQNEYPIKDLYNSGVIVTINTDNMTVSDTTLKNEYEIIRNNFGFTNSDINKLRFFSIKAAFLSHEEKVALTDELLRRIEKEKLTKESQTKLND